MEQYNNYVKWFYLNHILCCSYGKTKEAFGWPEENEEVTSVSNNAPANQNSYAMESEPLTVANTVPTTNLEKLTTGILELLDGTFTLYPFDDNLNNFKSLSIKTATKLLTMPTPPSIQMYSKSLLSVLHSSKQTYHCYKVNLMKTLIVKP